MIYQGETVRLLAQNVKDLSGNAITAPTSVSILVTKPDGTTETITTASNDGLGNYHYDLTIGTSDPVGTWSHLWTITDGTNIGIEESTFNVHSARIQ